MIMSCLLRFLLVFTLRRLWTPTPPSAFSHLAAVAPSPFTLAIAPIPAVLKKRMARKSPLREPSLNLKSLLKTQIL